MFGRRTLPLLVATVLGAATVTAALLGAAADRDTVRTARTHALEQTTQAAAALGTGLEARVSDVAGLFNASQSVTAAEFSAFTEPMLEDSTAASLSYVELVRRDDRAAFERQTGLAITERSTDGKRVTANADERYAVVRYTKTVDDNEAELGTDALSSAVDAAAIAAAERTRTPQSTRPVMLAGTQGPGVTLYVPVYGADAGPTATRQATGFVAATFRFQDLSIGLQATGAPTQLRISGAPDFKIGEVDGEVSTSRTVIAGRTWQLSVGNLPATSQLFGLTRGQLAAIVLTLLTLLITALTRSAVIAAERSDELAILRQAERDQAVRERQSTQAAADELLSHLPDLAVLRFDADLRIVDASGGLLPRAGWSREELEGRKVGEVFGEAGAGMLGPIRGALAGQASGFSFHGIRSASKQYWMQALPLPGDEPGGLLVTSDVTALMGAESARAEAQSRFERVFDSAPVGMALVNTDGKFVQVNEAMAQITGYDRGALLLMGPPNLTHPDDIAATKRQVRDLLSGAVPAMAIEKRYLHADGHTVWVSLNTTVLNDAAGAPEYILAHVLDITERHEFAEQLQHLANHDPLTDLRNRRSFEEALATQVAYVRRYREPAALLMIDLDHFKIVNDTHGHQAGDRVLTGAADTLRLALRDSDTLGRLGGDEFAVLLPKATAAEAGIVAEKVVHALKDLGERLACDLGQPAVTASIGVAIIAGDHRTIDEAFADADRALYAVKTAGRDGFAVAEPRARTAA